MPPTKQSAIVKLKKFVSQYGEKVFSTDNKILYCKLCDVKVTAEKAFTVQQHVATEKHKRGVQRIQNGKTLQQILLGECRESYSPFYEELCTTFLCADIPLSKLNHPKLREFLEKHTGKSIPDSSTLRKNYIDRCYEKTMQEIRHRVADKRIWVSIDETTDTMGRHVANVVVGTLEEDGPGEHFLINCEHLEKANFCTISKLFDRSMNLIWPGGVQHDNVLIFVSDAAPYMVKAADSLTALYSKMVHVTCLAHALHRVAEEIRSQFGDVDQLIGCVKKIFSKAPSRVATFKLEAPDVSLPPSPILTRWGSWIDACNYYAENFKVVKKVIDSFDNGEAASIRLAQELMSQNEISGKLAFIKVNYGFLPAAIAVLEQSNVPLVNQIELIKKTVNNVDGVCGKVGKEVSMKMKKVLEKNKGYNTLCCIENILKGENFSLDSTELDSSDIVYFKYAPLVSVEVERSFSKYKVLLSDNRQSFSFQNLHKVFIVHCNSGLIN